MAEINEGLIRKVSELARLELNEAEVLNYVQSITQILKHVDDLNEVDTTGVEPLVYGVDGSIRLRNDQVVEFGVDENGEPKVLSSAPETFDSSFKVPQIIS